MRSLYRRTVRELLLMVAALSSAACSTSVGARELALLVPPGDDPATREFVAALTNSPQIKDAGLVFRVLRSDLLGPPAQSAALLLDGKVPLALLRANQIPGYQTAREDLKFTSLLSHPLMVRDSKEQFHVEDSIVGDAVKQELGRKGFVVLGFWNGPSSSLVFSKMVNSYADLKGLKVGVPAGQAKDVLQAYGASPMNLAAGDVYAAMQRGAVDGSEARLERDSPFFSVAKGGSLVTGFQHDPGFLVANQAAWIGLRQRERVAIQAAALEAKHRAREAVLRVDEGVVESARTNGLAYASFASMGDARSTARSTWLRQVGDNGTAALRLYDQVVEQQAQPPIPPSSSPRSSAHPRIFFATNRNDEGGGDLSYRFGIDRSPALLCGEVGYTSDPKRRFGIAHTGGISVVGLSTVTGPAPCAQLLASSARADGGTLIVFIHGFNNSFDFAVRRAIAFAQDFGVTTPVLVFSWPSLGEVSGYVYDIGSVTYTRPFAKDFVEALLREPDLSSVSLLAHSMGSQIAFQVLEFATASRKHIESVVFVAPDVPRANFLQGIQLYGASTRLATLYANEHDRALLLSKTVNRQAPAGLGGTSRLTALGVETIDVSEVDKQWYEVNHSHGFDVLKVASDVSLVLRQRVKASERNLPSGMQGGATYWLIKP